MTDDPPAAPLPPRLLLLNGAPGAGGDQLARNLRLAWDAATVPVDDLELALERARPIHNRGEDPRIRELRSYALIKVGALVAQAYPPLAVAASTISSRYELDTLIRGWRDRAVDVAHVLLSLAEDELAARIHRRGGEADARRWALRQAHGATRDLATLPADIHLDVTRWDPDRLTAELAQALSGLGWIGDDGHWRTTPTYEQLGA